MAEIVLPDIASISARGRAGGADWAVIADLNNANLFAIDADRYVTADEVRSYLDGASDIDRDRDYLFVEVGGEPVAYALASTYVEHGGRRVYRHNCKVHPNWRDRGIGTALLDWLASRHRERLEEHGPGVLQTEADDVDAALVAMLTARGYRAVAHEADLVRPHLDDLPARPLPDGLELRPVEESHLRAIFEADADAFRDHWGTRPRTEADWEAFLAFAHRDESLWKVAWDGDRVVSQVRGYVNEEENRVRGRKRGWAEFISTVHDWRGRGAAGALIVETLREFKRLGLEEAALGVHVENPTGAFSLYQGLGFEVVSHYATYERPLEA